MRRLVRGLLVVVLALVALAVVGALAFYVYDEVTLSAQAGATPQVPPAAAAARSETIGVDLPRGINVATVNLLNGREDVVVVDIRSEGDYERGHVPGAMSAPAAQLEARTQSVPRDVAVIVVCSTGRTSSGAVARLEDAGFTDVHEVIGGMRAWRKAGLEIEE